MLIPVTSRTRVKRSGISPLHLAAERNNDDILEELIEAGYEVNTALSDERSCLYEDRRTTPLYFAVFNNNIYATELLLQAGANPNVDLINPLLISIRHGCLKTMKLLLDHGANIDAYISSHPTTFPATIMFSMKYLSVLKYLLDLGCDAGSCFECQYGNGPHPALNYRRERLNDPQVTREPAVVQVSTAQSTCRTSKDIYQWVLTTLVYFFFQLFCKRKCHNPYFIYGKKCSVWASKHSKFVSNDCRKVGNSHCGHSLNSQWIVAILTVLPRVLQCSFPLDLRHIFLTNIWMIAYGR